MDARVRSGKKRIVRNTSDPRKDVAVPLTECCTRTGIKGGEKKTEKKRHENKRVHSFRVMGAWRLNVPGAVVELGSSTVHGLNHSMGT